MARKARLRHLCSQAKDMEAVVRLWRVWQLTVHEKQVLEG